MSKIDELISKLNKHDTEYNLGNSDFAQVKSVNNGLVDCILMQRNFLYKDCILLGNTNVGPGSKGILLFVSKAKYPVFIPIYFVNDSVININPGDILVSVPKSISNNPVPLNTKIVNLRDELRNNGLSEGIHFKYRDGSPQYQQYTRQDVAQSIINIVKEWFSFNKGSILVVCGDCSFKNGGYVDPTGIRNPHSGTGHANWRAMDTYLSNNLEINRMVTKNNKQVILDFFDICFRNGAVVIGWQPPEFLKNEFEQRYQGKVQYWSGHASHFHLGFIGVIDGKF